MRHVRFEYCGKNNEKSNIQLCYNQTTGKSRQVKAKKDKFAG
jgi:hypothetical protein